MNRLFIAIATAGVLFAAPALAQGAGSAASADPVAQAQTSQPGQISQDFSARRHYYRWHRYRHYRHYGWYRGHHWGWRHRHHRHWYYR